MPALAPTDRLSPPLFCRTTVPTRPDVVPPMVFLHTTCTLVTLLLPTVPLPFVTVHRCAGEEGWVETVTLYEMPLGKAVGRIKLPSALTVISSKPSVRTRPVPSMPDTVPPMV